MKTILITGGSGFIGKSLKEYLELYHRDRYDVYAPSSRDLDVTDEASVNACMDERYYDHIFHFGYYTNYNHPQRDASKILEYNLRSFELFKRRAKSYGRLYYSGSGAEYDKTKDIVNVSEEDTGNTIPKDEYGLLKYIIGQQIEHCDNIYNLRIFGLFGKYEYYPAKFISGLCAKAVLDLPLTVRQNVYFDFLWIDDFCRMVTLLMEKEHPDHHTYNMVTGKKISLVELCNIVNSVSGKNLPVVVCKEGFNLEYTASNERFISEFPDFKYTDIYDSVAKLYKYFADNKSDIDISKLIYG